MDFTIFFIACQLFFVLNGALAPCRMERSGMRLNLFLFSAVRVFNTFNTFNRFSTKCCTIDFVILRTFNISTFFPQSFQQCISLLIFVLSLKFITFQLFHSLYYYVYNKLILYRACARARYRACAYVRHKHLLDRLNRLIYGAFRRQKPSTLLDRYWAR